MTVLAADVVWQKVIHKRAKTPKSLADDEQTFDPVFIIFFITGQFQPSSHRLNSDSNQ